MKRHQTLLETIVILTRRDAYGATRNGQHTLSTNEASRGEPRSPEGKDLHKYAEVPITGNFLTCTRARLVRSFPLVRMTIAVYLLSFVASFAQNSAVDSLQTLLKTSIADTTRVTTLIALGNELGGGHVDSALRPYGKALELANNANHCKGVAAASSKLGFAYWKKGDYQHALNIFNSALKSAESCGSQLLIGRALSNIGVVHWKRGDYPEALEFFFKSIEAFDRSGDSTAASNAYMNVGIIYAERRDHPNAIKYNEKAMTLIEKEGIPESIASISNNMGLLYNQMGALAPNDSTKQAFYSKAEYYFKRALKIREELNDERALTDTRMSIGQLFDLRGEADTAMKYYIAAMDKYAELGARESYIMMCSAIGFLQMKIGNFETAVEYFLKGMEQSRDLGILVREKESYYGLTNAYEEIGNYGESLKYYKLYASTKDSLFNEQKSKELGKLEARHEFETTEIERKRTEEEQAKQEAAAKSRRDNLQYSGILIFLVLVFAAVFMLGKFSIPIRLAEGMTFFAFLLFFEFMLVMLDPYIDGYSGGEPAYKLLFNAVLAGLIFPLHSFFESKLKSRLAK